MDLVRGYARASRSDSGGSDESDGRELGKRSDEKKSCKGAGGEGPKQRQQSSLDSKARVEHLSALGRIIDAAPVLRGNSKKSRTPETNARHEDRRREDEDPRSVGKGKVVGDRTIPHDAKRVKTGHISSRVLFDHDFSEHMRECQGRLFNAAAKSPGPLTYQQPKQAENASTKVPQRSHAAHTESPVAQAFSRASSELHYRGFSRDTRGESAAKESSIVQPPAGWKKDTQLEVVQNFVPKSVVQTLQGHTKPVSSVRFFPHFGHLLLSSSMDSSLKLWTIPDLRNTRDFERSRCAVTYRSHGKAVRDVSFSHNGELFVSASFDGSTKVWNTETAAVLRSLEPSDRGVTPVCVQFQEGGSGVEHEFLVGNSNGSIEQFDTRCPETSAVQTYRSHLGSVDTLVFLDGGKRFVSSSDDKSLHVWEYGVPVVVKYIAEPDMYSMPACARHPSGRALCYQSMNNRVVSYSISGDRFKPARSFSGHLIAGYACELDISPDGRFLASGDSLGRLFFWDWRSSRVLHCAAAHDSVCSSVRWHPTQPSVLVSAGWDNSIKLWR